MSKRSLCSDDGLVVDIASCNDLLSVMHLTKVSLFFLRICWTNFAR